MGTVTAKILCIAKHNTGWGTELTFGTDYTDGRNAEWAAATPSLSVSMTVNDDAAQHFAVSEPYTLMFIPGDGTATETHAVPAAAKAHHPAVADVLRHFAYDHLPAHLQAVSKPISELAHRMAALLNGPQLTIGLQDLLRAKDAFVRAALPAAAEPEQHAEV